MGINSKDVMKLEESSSKVTPGHNSCSPVLVIRSPAHISYLDRSLFTHLMIRHIAILVRGIEILVATTTNLLRPVAPIAFDWTAPFL